MRQIGRIQNDGQLSLEEKRNFKGSSPISYKMNKMSEVQTSANFESYEIHSTFYPPSLSPFPPRFFGKRLGF